MAELPTNSKNAVFVWSLGLTMHTSAADNISQVANLALQGTSHDFQQTGGVHNAALCTPDEVLLTRSDIGRHNALDKIFGYSLQNRIAPGDKIIVFSGRISSEVLLKAAKIGVGIVLSKSAPTTLALDCPRFGDYNGWIYPPEYLEHIYPSGANCGSENIRFLETACFSLTM